MNVAGLDIELTQRCNLKCPYCYIGQGRCQSAETISRETLDDCLDLIAVWGQPRPTPQQKATEVTFYGGEPLLAFGQLRHFVEAAWARGYRLRYAAVSNGTIDRPEIVDYCCRRGIRVQRSLDGCPEAMEKCRGAGTLERYNRATAIWRDYDQTRRMTVIPETARYLWQSLKYFTELGFRKGLSPQPDYYADWSPQHVEDFKTQLWELGSEIVRDVRAGRPAFYHYWFDREYDRFRAVPNRSYKSGVGCGAGKGLWCCSWDGFLFICHRFASEPRDSQFCAGPLRAVVENSAPGVGQGLRESLQRYWRREVPVECRSCIGRYGCTMGCYHVNFKCQGDIGRPPALYCELKREAAQVVTWIDSRLRDQNPRWWDGSRRQRPAAATGLETPSGQPVGTP